MKLEVIDHKEMTDNEVVWYCLGFLQLSPLPPEIMNRFDEISRGIDWDK